MESAAAGAAAGRWRRRRQQEGAHGTECIHVGRTHSTDDTRSTRGGEAAATAESCLDGKGEQQYSKSRRANTEHIAVLTCKDHIVLMGTSGRTLAA